jgi:hypothetical protein
MTRFPIMYDNSPAIFKTAPTITLLLTMLRYVLRPLTLFYDFLLTTVPLVYVIFSNIYDPVSWIYRLLSSLTSHMASFCAGPHSPEQKCQKYSPLQPRITGSILLCLVHTVPVLVHKVLSNTAPY